MEKFQEVIVAQAGNPAVAEDRSLLPVSPLRHEILADEAGFVTKCDARDIGVAGVRLGAGRSKKEDVVDPGVGISVLAKIGDKVEKGQPLAVIAYRDEEQMEAAKPLLQGAWEVGDAVAKPELVIGRID